MAHIETTGFNLPEIYAYETPGVTYHEGWIKVGDTQGEFEKRIGQQTNTAGIIAVGYCLGFAVYLDGSRKTFRDKAFHQFLVEKGINDKHPGWPGDEWFEISLDRLKILFEEFTHNPPLSHKIDQIVLREEQEEAIAQTVEYHNSTTNGEFLWNAKPRFGKTISAMEFCKRIDAKNVLVLTNMPAVANSWYEDYCEYLGPDSGYVFVSSTPDLKGKEFVLSRDEYISKLLSNTSHDCRCFEFVSLQDLKGSIYYGGQFDKLGELQKLEWDAVFLDEAHEGVDTIKTEFALDKIRRKFTLHLSGTPFKQIKNQKFDENAIFNWTYVDEQEKKAHWSGSGENPYEELPKLNMYTYRMSNLVEASKHADLNDDEFEYAYKLNKFFETNSNHEFIHRSDVLKFLDALTTEGKFPLSSKQNRDALAHSFWLMPSVSASIAMANELKQHPIFKGYEVINVAGDIRGLKKESDEYDKENAAYGIVKTAIANHDKTITLSVQRLTTGVTVPEWTAVFILSEIRSAQTYMQAAFRAQNPCIFNIKGKHVRKTNSFVFDFNPERSLDIIEQFANDLYSNTADGRGSYDDRKENIAELLKYLPVSGEDDNGNFSILTAEQVLSIPRSIRCTEVVRRGFMCNFLFASDFSGIFRAPSVVTNILNQLSVPKNTKKKVPIDIPSTASQDLHLNDRGEIEISPDDISKNADTIVGKKELEDLTKKQNITLPVFTRVETDAEKEDSRIKNEMRKTADQIANNLIDKEKSKSGGVSKSAETKIRATTLAKVERATFAIRTEKNTELMTAEKDIRDMFADCPKDEVDALVQEERDKIETKYKEIQDSKILEIAEESRQDCSKILMTEKCEKEKNSKEDEIREHLKGFARTIPSFLMAYGNENTTLETFEHDIPADVFKDVTSITIEEFVFLRDGGDREDENGELVHFDGHVFETTVFNDSVKAFLKKRQELSDYFEQAQKEDIFDYIPPQKTNQIYTPKAVVQTMIAKMEHDNPGCFDDETKTFIDLYMKSGLFITEIVKKLYRSDKMKALYPDGKERLKHIFENQVYGLAPTEIIYKIATNFIFGSELTKDINTSHFVMLDAQPYVENGTLEQKLDEIFKSL